MKHFTFQRIHEADLYCQLNGLPSSVLPACIGSSSPESQAEKSYFLMPEIFDLVAGPGTPCLQLLCFAPCFPFLLSPTPHPFHGALQKQYVKCHMEHRHVASLHLSALPDWFKRYNVFREPRNMLEMASIFLLQYLSDRTHKAE